jgi:hypothetical protein
VRGSSIRPLFVTAVGDAQRRRGGPGPAHGRPAPATRRTAPRRYPRAGRSARSQPDRPPAQLTCTHARNACRRGYSARWQRCINIRPERLSAGRSRDCHPADGVKDS